MGQIKDKRELERGQKKNQRQTEKETMMNI